MSIKTLDIKTAQVEGMPDSMPLFISNPTTGLREVLERFREIADPRVVAIIEGVIEAHDTVGWETITEDRLYPLIRLFWMMQSLVYISAMSHDNGLKGFLLPEFTRQIAFKTNAYLVDIGSAAIGQAAEDARLSIWHDANTLIGKHDAWGLRIMTEITLWATLRHASAADAVDKAFASHVWTPKNYLFNDQVLPSLRNHVKSCPLDPEGNFLSTPAHTRARAWVSGVLGTMGRESQILESLSLRGLGKAKCLNTMVE